LNPPPDVADLLRHQQFVRAIARQLLRDENRVDDVEQETWIAALERPPGLGARLPAWLAAVARNFALRRLRDDTRRLRREKAAARPEGQPAVEDVVEELEAHRNVVEAVHALDEPYRSTILLRYHKGLRPGAIAKYHKGLRPGAIAKLQGVPAATVRSRTHTGLQLLRARLKRRDYRNDERALALALLPLACTPARAGKLAAATGIAAAVAVTVIAIGVMRPEGAQPTPRSEFARSDRRGAATPLPRQAEGSSLTPNSDQTTRGSATQASGTLGPGTRAKEVENKPTSLAVPKDAVGGYVSDDGRPLPGGRAYLLPYERYGKLPIRWRDDPEVQRTYVAADGTFWFRDLKPSFYVVAVACDGRPLRETTAQPGRRVEFPFGGAAVTGRALDPVGRPFVGANVQVNRKLSPVSVWVEVGADGMYYADGLPEGVYWVAISGPGAGRLDPGAITRNVELKRGKTAMFDVGRAAALPRWTGTLRDAAGTTVGPGRIQLNAAEGGYSYIPVDNEGRFAFPFMPGKYKAVLHVAGRSFLDAGKITLPETDHWQDLEVRGACVRGRLTRPKVPTSVRLERDWFKWVRVAEDGSFVIYGVPVGTHRLARKPDPIDMVVEVTAGQTSVTVREKH
jgi:RNA polymerase sigma factor (sigma-70 family)